MSENKFTPSHQAHQVTTELSNVEQILHAIQEQKQTHKREEDAFQGDKLQEQDTAERSIETEQHGTAPHTLIEKRLTAIWKEFLGLERIGIYDNFFDLGGDSVQATQILSRVQEVFHVEFSLEVLFTIDVTISEFAKLIEQKQIEQANSEELALLLQEVHELNDDDVQTEIANISKDSY